ncbi:MAG: cupin domain-containing protein [Bacillota bacterium]
MDKRLFSVEEVLKEVAGSTDAVKTVLYENPRSNGVLWYVPPGKEVPAHYHPETDDTWIVLEGEGEYYLGNGETHPLYPGLVAVAPKEAIHGAMTTGDKPLVFVAISAPMPVTMIKTEK